MIHAQYVAHMHDDLAVANIARVSFHKWKSVQDLSDEKLIKFLAREKHELPFRHPHVTLRCQAPIYIARQLGKHQVGMEWSEISRRYVDHSFEFDIPEEIRSRPVGGIKQGSGGIHEDSDSIIDMIDEWTNQAHERYEQLIEWGVAPEQARMVLPQNMVVTWVWTGSLLAFHHMWKLRFDGHAQKEAQDFASAVYDIIAPLYPIAWKALSEERTNEIWYVVADMDDGKASTHFFRDQDAYIAYQEYAYDGGFLMDEGHFIVEGKTHGLYFTTYPEVIAIMGMEERSNAAD